MNITDTPLRPLMYIFSVLLHPITIASGFIVGQGLDNYRANLLALGILNGQLYFLISLIDKQFRRRLLWAYQLPINRQHSITNLDVEARRG